MSEIAIQPGALAAALCIFAVTAHAQIPGLRNASVYVPDGPESGRISKILAPGHMIVRAHARSEQNNLYMYQPGQHADAPRWEKRNNALEYTPAPA
jgi:hypothetical protein